MPSNQTSVVLVVLLFLVLLARHRYKLSCALQIEAQKLDDFIGSIEARYSGRYMPYGLYLAIEGTEPIYEVVDSKAGIGIGRSTLNSFQAMVAKARIVIEKEAQLAQQPINYEVEFAISNREQSRLNSPFRSRVLAYRFEQLKKLAINSGYTF